MYDQSLTTGLKPQRCAVASCDRFKCLNHAVLRQTKIHSITIRPELHYQFKTLFKYKMQITSTPPDLGYFMLQELAVLKDHFTVGQTHFKSPADTLFGMISLSML